MSFIEVKKLEVCIRMYLRFLSAIKMPALFLIKMLCIFTECVYPDQEEEIKLSER